MLHLPAGAYTAIVRGANDGTGIGLAEVYTSIKRGLTIKHSVRMTRVFIGFAALAYIKLHGLCRMAVGLRLESFALFRLG